MSETVSTLVRDFLANPLFDFILILGIVGFLMILNNTPITNKENKKKTINKKNNNIFKEKEINLPMSYVNGKTGESKVVGELIKLPVSDYCILNDCTFKVHDKTTQIDHIIVSKYGIFVIETKHYNNSYIAGKDIDKFWTHIYGKKKYFSQNPVKQNDVHVKKLMSLLNLNYDMFIPIVCICGSNLRFNINSTKTVKITDLVKKILSFNEVILPNYKIIYDKLESYNIHNTEVKKEHVLNAKNIQNKNNNNLTKCPWCINGYLVKRTGENRKFYGCTNYPKCEYTKIIK